MPEYCFIAGFDQPPKGAKSLNDGLPSETWRQSEQRHQREFHGHYFYPGESNGRKLFQRFEDSILVVAGTIRLYRETGGTMAGPTRTQE